MDKIDLLARYSELTAIIESAKYDLEFVEDCLKTIVEETGAPLSAYGLVARFKPGRKTINHEAAVMEQINEYVDNGMHTLGSALEATIERFSTTKVTVKWVEVTKAARIDTAPFTVESEPVFVVEAVQS